jgi:hypothetical protein
VEVDDADAVHAMAVEQGLEIEYPLRDEEWGVRSFMLREPSGLKAAITRHFHRPRHRVFPRPDRTRGDPEPGLGSDTAQ